MSNSIIPSFLPPPFDFTTEENEETEEEDDAEEESENTCKRSRAREIFCGTIFALVVYGLIGPVIKIDLKVSIS